MPRRPLHALAWSPGQGLYELATGGRLVRRFHPSEEAAWLAWLGEAGSLAFHGAAGALNVFHEPRRGRRYWYAYHTGRGGIRKAYLGSTERVTLRRLEEVARALTRGATPRPPGAGPVSTKLMPPGLPRSLVVRERLLSALDAALSHRLTLVSAPAGSGKTTLLASWARRQRDGTAWLSLEEADDSPTRFWVALILALRSRADRAGETALGLLQSPQPPPLFACLGALIEDLQRAGPIVLVLDQYDAVRSPAVQESFAFWLERVPAHVRVVVASRSDPDLPLARWRVRGLLAELRGADLRFSHEETGVWLQEVLGSALPEAEVAALQQRTEGWAAGLHLAALSLRGRADRTQWIADWTGGQRNLLDYVKDEILAHQPDDVRQFLLRTSVLNRLSASLCQAVLAEPETGRSQRMLEALERANLFVVPLDEERRAYRVHDLFREALRARLAAMEPELVAELHLRAARFHEAAGDDREAIDHALAARDFAYAGRLLARAAPRLWIRGEDQAVQAWLAALPDAVLWRQAGLALDSTLHFLESLTWTTEGNYARAMPLVEPLLGRLRALLRDSPAGAEAIQARLRLLEGLLEARGLIQDGERRLAQLVADLAGLARRQPVSWSMIVLAMQFWLTEGLRREGALLIPQLQEAKRRADVEGEPLQGVRALSWLALVHVRARAWPEVLAEARDGLSLLARSGVQSPFAGYLHFSAAEALYAWNRLDEAADALAESLRIGEYWQQFDLLVTGRFKQSACELARGALPAADAALRQAEALVREGPLPIAYLVSAAGAFRAAYWLAAGNLAAAGRWADETDISADAWHPNDQWAARMLVRVRLAQHRAREALDLLDRFREPMHRPGDPSSATEWLALSVASLHEGGQHHAAGEALGRLLALTRPAQDVRLYLDLGQPMRQALQAFARASAPDAHLSRLLQAFRRSGPARRPPEGSQPTPEALTRREREVLRLLAGGASNRDIAEALVISPATAKRHVSNLLGKLGVGSRGQAVAVSRGWPMS